MFPIIVLLIALIVLGIFFREFSKGSPKTIFEKSIIKLHNDYSAKKEKGIPYMGYGDSDMYNV